ncbi:MAG: glycosyltransferase family 1 protein [Candidatus Omnitrophota bacterium]
MRIGIDARILTGAPTGIGNYLQHILHALSLIDHENDYVLYTHVPSQVTFNNPRWQKHEGAHRWGPQTCWMMSTGALQVYRDKIDLFWAPWPMVPFYLPCKIALTVCDLVWEHYPQAVHPAQMLMHKLLTSPSINRADIIFSISEASLNDVRRFYPNKTNLHLTYCSVNPVYAPCPKAAARAYLAQKFGLVRPFLLDVATIEPKKNLPLLFKAFKKLKMDHGLEHQLVIAGGKGWLQAPIYKTLMDMDFRKDDVIFLGYVENNDLKMLYNAADVFAFPSLWEGFGIPPLEAMHCGCPVIVSNIPALSEVVGDAGLKVDPSDADALAMNIKRIIDSASLRDELILKGLKRCQDFSWEKSARTVLDAFKNL